MRTYVEWVIRFRGWVIMAVLLITAVLVLQIRHLRVVIDPNLVLPQDHPFVTGHEEIETVFGIDRVFVIALSPRSGDIFSSAFLEKIKAITDALDEDEELRLNDVLSLSARRVKDIRGTELSLEADPLMDEVPRTPEEMERLRAAIQLNPVYIDSIVSRDLGTAAVVVDLHIEGSYRPVVDRIDAIVAPHRDADTEIAITGAPAFNALTERYSQRLLLLFPLVVLVIGVVHFEAFRTGQALVLPLVTAIVSVLWSLGLMGIARVPLDAFNVTTPILILAVAAGHAVQILKRFYEAYGSELAAGRSASRETSRAAVVESLVQIGPVMIAAGAVASLGFLSLLSINIATIRTFGLFAAIGIIATLVLELSFIPALRATLPPPGMRETSRESQERFWDRMVAAVGRLSTGPDRNRIYVLVGAFIVVCAVGAWRIQMENSTKAYFFKSHPLSVDDDHVNEALGGANTIFVMVQTAEEGGIYEPAILQGLERTQRFLEQQPYVGKTLSIADFVKKMNREMNGGDAAFDRIPERRDTIAQYLLLYSSSADADDFDKYVDTAYRSAAIWSFIKTDSTRETERLVGALRPVLREQFGEHVRVEIGGSVPRTTALNEVLVHAKLWNMAQLAIVISVVSFAILRSVLGALLVLTPLALTVLGNLGIMGWSGIPLNTGTAVVSALAVGIGADYAIYLIYRIREEAQRGLAPEEAIRRSLGTAGKAILFVASAVASGYCVLFLSYGFYLHMWFAILIPASMVISAWGTLLTVPTILMTLRPSFVFGAKQEGEATGFLSAASGDIRKS